MLSEKLTKASIAVAENDDQTAFQELFRHFFPGMLSFAASYMKNRMMAEEVVEDVFVKLWENRKMLPAIRNLNYYLYVATKHAALNALKKDKSQDVIAPIDDLEEETLRFNRTPEDVMISEQTLKEIEAIVNSLPGRCRLIFRLVKEEGLRYREVAELLNISEKTVENQMTIAIRKLTARTVHLISLRNAR
ncbi:RNA polymerase sigma-70 factor [Filimonas effusa]|uniref:RNA polymerase sigma-70 factor n=1 Tax=Filimonas effusa TaxID=2508721 RepID=A0A4V1MAC9_9BACT|nr:RNA polymerase sigma-70 factor [Filimonas effusa]RXK85436.1 RNA polymerase sigma-70 factor [Filimonas effusa]